MDPRKNGKWVHLRPTVEQKDWRSLTSRKLKKEGKLTRKGPVYGYDKKSYESYGSKRGKLRSQIKLVYGPSLDPTYCLWSQIVGTLSEGKWEFRKTLLRKSIEVMGTYPSYRISYFSCRTSNPSVRDLSLCISLGTWWWLIDILESVKWLGELRSQRSRHFTNMRKSSNLLSCVHFTINSWVV